MPIELTVLPQFEFLHVDYWGVVTFGELATGFQDFVEKPFSETVKYSLNDMRNMTDMRMPEQALTSQAELVATGLQEKGIAHRMAIVAGNIPHLVVARDYSDYYARHTQNPCSAFMKIGDAIRWLGVDPAVMEEKLPNGQLVGAPSSSPSV
ncbi:conserved hypothetical protein [Roseibium sp. TrichSKD4]|uniref:hypothetical protein n=1 Tax=Roseibium sp. TrichSKD4 TaxID=744980 RepID=UPI0001E573DA|nr:hypothetical protein [Roseibium sp. TrichSKD4]EFO29830.1 conserved hypothetical protein [Roseibium sp. TrichSKD4]